MKACDGGTDVWNLAYLATGKTPAVKIQPGAGGFGGSANAPSATISISPTPDCCAATDVAIHELTNLSNATVFAKIHADAIAGNLSRTDYIKANEKVEYEGVQNALKAFAACKGSWGCPAGAVSPLSGFQSAKDFDDYYNHYLAANHKEYYGKFWDANFKAAYNKKHPS